MKYRNRTSWDDGNYDPGIGQVRVAGALLDNSTRCGGKTSLTDIARSLEFTTRQVNDSLRSLSENGLIEMKRGRIVIKDQDLLKAVSSLPGTR